MGACGSVPESPTLDTLKNKRIGEIWESPQGCCPDIGGRQSGSGYDRCTSRGFNFPNNGEFEWLLGGSCSMCSDPSTGYGCSGCTSAGSIGGKKPAVKRIAYNGDPVQCCLTGNAIVNGNTCDPKYRGGSGSSDCSSVVSNVCASDPSTSTCRTWGTTNKDLYNGYVKSYCSNINNLKTQFCKDKVIEIGGVDSTYQQLCNDPQYKDTQFCSCGVSYPTDYADIINSNPQIKNVLDNPKCYNKTCVQYGYQTSNQRAFTCPNLNICSNVINLTDSTDSSANRNVQTCIIDSMKNQSNSGSNSDFMDSNYGTFAIIGYCLVTAIMTIASHLLFGKIISFITFLLFIAISVIIYVELNFVIEPSVSLNDAVKFLITISK